VFNAQRNDRPSAITRVTFHLLMEVLQTLQLDREHVTFIVVERISVLSDSSQDLSVLGEMSLAANKMRVLHAMRGNRSLDGQVLSDTSSSSRRAFNDLRRGVFFVVWEWHKNASITLTDNLERLEFSRWSFNPNHNHFACEQRQIHRRDDILIF